jgi:hypothetical protein
LGEDRKEYPVHGKIRICLVVQIGEEEPQRSLLLVGVLILDAHRNKMRKREREREYPNDFAAVLHCIIICCFEYLPK